MKVFDKVFQRDGAPLRVVAHRSGKGQFEVEVGGRKYEVAASRRPDGGLRLVVDGEGFSAYCAPAGRTMQVRVGGQGWNLEYERHGPAEQERGDGVVEAPMTGTVTAVLVKAGETVSAGERLILLTAMKMEHSLEAGTSGVVTEVNAEEGQSVEQGTVLIRIEDGSAGDA